MFYERLKVFRILRGLSQEELSKMAGVSQAAVARHETAPGKPREETLRKYAEALQLPVHDLVSGHPFHRGIYRPYNPFKMNSSRAIKRMEEDLIQGISYLMNLFSLKKAYWFDTNLGSILVMKSNGSVLILVLPTAIEFAVRNFVARNFPQVQEYDVKEELFVSTLMDPESVASREFLPGGLECLREVVSPHFYRTPQPSTKVTIEVTGNPYEPIETMIARLRSDLISTGYKVVNINASQVDAPCQYLPQNIQQWFEHH